MADGQGTGNKWQYLRGAVQLLGGRRLLAASVLTTAINGLALTGPAYTLLLFGHTLPKGEPLALLAATIIMLGLYALGAAIDIARQRLLMRCAQRIDRRLTAMAVPRPGSALPELNAVRAFLGSQLPAALCDAPWVPLCLLALALLHPSLCALAMAGAAAIGGCLLVIDRRWRRELAAAHRLAEHAAGRWVQDTALRSDMRRHAQKATAHKAVLITASLRALRPALQSTMLGLGGYLVMTGACHPASVVASAIILPRLLSPIETILAQWQTLAAAHRGAVRLAAQRASWAAIGESRGEPADPQRVPGGVRIVLRRSGDYARSATRGGARSESSDLRPTAQ